MLTADGFFNYFLLVAEKGYQVYKNIEAHRTKYTSMVGVDYANRQGNSPFERARHLVSIAICHYV
jgi:hypothetical protein